MHEGVRLHTYALCALHEILGSFLRFAKLKQHFQTCLEERLFFFFPLYFYSSIKNTLQLRSDLFHAYLSCATAISHTISYTSSSSRQLSRSCISNPTWFRVWAHGESYVRPLSGLCNMPWPPGSGYQALLTSSFIALDVLP